MGNNSSNYSSSKYIKSNNNDLNIKFSDYLKFGKDSKHIYIGDITKLIIPVSKIIVEYDPIGLSCLIYSLLFTEKRFFF
jgi:hypothetical protein